MYRKAVIFSLLFILITPLSASFERVNSKSINSSQRASLLNRVKQTKELQRKSLKKSFKQARFSHYNRTRGNRNRDNGSRENSSRISNKFKNRQPNNRLKRAINKKPPPINRRAPSVIKRSR